MYQTTWGVIIHNVWIFMNIADIKVNHKYTHWIKNMYTSIIFVIFLSLIKFSALQAKRPLNYSRCWIQSSYLFFKKFWMLAWAFKSFQGNQFIFVGYNGFYT